MKRSLRWGAALCAGALATSCAVVVPKKPPTIAHTHIGHSLTGWRDTPDQAGLFVTAEKEATFALAAAHRAMEPGTGLTQVRGAVAEVMHAVDPGARPGGQGGLGYGLKKGLVGAESHIVFAAESDDATANVRAMPTDFSLKVQAVVDRCDLIVELGRETLQATSVEEAAGLAEEILNLSQANVSGQDLDGDGSVGPDPGETGLRQLRADLAAMIAREVPAYTPVDHYFLFGLFRLPSGKWAFRAPDTEEDGFDGGGGGGY